MKSDRDEAQSASTKASEDYEEKKLGLGYLAERLTAEEQNQLRAARTNLQLLQSWRNLLP